MHCMAWHSMAWTLFRLFVCLFISDYYFITRWLWKWFHRIHKIQRKYLNIWNFCLVMVYGVDLYSTLLVECSTLFNVTKWLNDTKKEWNIFRQKMCDIDDTNVNVLEPLTLLLIIQSTRWMSLCCYCFHAVLKTEKIIKIKSFICSGRSV